ncbi:hypothetical protein ABZU76_26690 [Amycolatopsis sp. NPDC005232]|uniref:hypothetical protein n=1 Tax=Amycolatopsis sp. NPDC005232 TaxID=3157027 RepID=UPI0033B476B9
MRLAVHTVVRSRGWLWPDAAGSAVELMPGDVTLGRGGPDHHIGHEPSAECLDPELLVPAIRSDVRTSPTAATLVHCLGRSAAERRVAGHAR